MNALFAAQSLDLGSSRMGPDDKQRLADLRKKIPGPILTHYDRLRSRGKKGVALVRNGVCGECHISIPTGTIVTLRHGLDVQVCGNCGRYLHWIDPEPAAPEAAPDRPKSPPRVRKTRIKAPAMTR